ncbi:MAG: response regulator [Eubacterium sp.]|nr:response regulator [Eubacterium sp.]
MLEILIYSMIFLGAALMVFNIYGFISYARFVKSQKSWNSRNGILYVPIVLLIFFLLGYLFIGIFGEPDIMVAAILFGGSIFVFIMYRILRGITLQLLKNEQQEAALLAREESSRIKASFLANVSHEMRTPMNVIIGLDNLALKDPTLRPETRQYLKKIDLSATHMLGLVNNILNMHETNQDSLPVQEEEFSLGEALEQVNVIVNSMCADKGLQYSYSPPSEKNVAYIGDAMKLKQVLLNILDNAVKYTETPGEISFRTDVEYSGEKALCRFTIRDTGIGMDEEFISHVFDAFSKEDEGITNRFGGSGLGLSVTKKAVDLMGGSINVESKKGKGSSFTVTLPFRITEIKAPVLPQKEESNLEGKKILIVEDLPENAEIVADLLELEGMETEHAENGQVALEMFRNQDAGYYDAILMDLRMPVMDGLTATREIRALTRPDAKTIPIIGLTANAFDSDIKASLSAGMNVHLAKPTDADLLYLTLKGEIERQQGKE